MFTYILVALAAVVLLFLAIVAMQPAEFRVTRTATIDAPPGEVFPHVNDLHNWEAWSPWAKLDPEMKLTYDGPAEGAGASYTWSGNNKVGEGRTTITESRPNERIRLKLEFVRPFAATNDVEFTFRSQGRQTSVTWDMQGRNGFMSKAFCLFVNMDKMVGGDFEKGLAQLKAVVEAQAAEQTERVEPLASGTES
jgi:uncharacterized protein YndB with AHSA1/START domain